MGMGPTASPRALVSLLAVWALCLTVPTFGYPSHQEVAGVPQGALEGQQKQRTQPAQSPTSSPTQSRPSPSPELGGYYKWWQDAVLAKEIGLTDQQKARIDKIFDQREKDIEPFVNDLAEQRARMQQMIEDRVVDVPTLQLQVSRVDSLTARVHESRVIMLYRIWLVLTADQYRKLEAYQKRARGGRRGGGPYL
jgi:Spy/CpxP family protein refolding chaperone